MNASNLLGEENILSNDYVKTSLLSETDSAVILPSITNSEGAFNDPLNLELEELSLGEQTVLKQPIEELQPSGTIFGTNDADILTGDNQNNVIVALAGNDTVLGKGGNDSLEGNSDRDRLS